MFAAAAIHGVSGHSQFRPERSETVQSADRRPGDYGTSCIGRFQALYAEVTNNLRRPVLEQQQRIRTGIF
jgi:hypothetical protein